MSGHSDEKKKVVHATICAPGAESLRAFCMSHGVTITAFLDGLSHVLCQWQDTPIPELDKVAPNIAQALRSARLIDAERRTRDPKLANGGTNGRH